MLAVDCSCVGRVQSFISQLLYVAVGQAEQPLPPLSAGVGRPANRKVVYNDTDETAALVCLRCTNSVEMRDVARVMLLTFM